MAEPVINAHNLTKCFGDKTVVDQVSLTVHQGDVYGFLGPNGSGKTTTLRMLCGLLPIDGGSGTCLGYDLLTESWAIKARVGYMTQQFSLYGDLTPQENLHFLARLFQIPRPKQRVAETLEQIGIGPERQKQPANTLSGGWKQRLALGAATLHHPALLLLDEPTAGVDPKARRDFWDEIFRLSRQGVTTLVSTHYMDEAERCNKLAYIAYGRLLSRGSPEEIIQAARLQTWEVRGSNLAALKKALNQYPGIQVTPFGRTLHVTAPADECLDALIQHWQAQNYNWQRITASLEDVFIQLMQQNQDNFV